MTRIVSLIFIVLILAVGLFFGLLNAEPAEVNYYLGTVPVPLSIVIVVSLIAGAVLGVFASLGVILRLKHQKNRLRRQLNKAGIVVQTKSTG